VVKIGIVSDTHIISKDDPEKINSLLDQLKKIFKDVDEIVHAGDVCNQFFLNALKDISPIKCVRGDEDEIKDLEAFIRFKIGNYNIGVIHELPDNIESFVKEYRLHILIYGHTHAPIIKGTTYNTLILNPGSPTKPIAPPEVKGFKIPVARPSVLTLNIDENNVITTFLINLKL